MARAMASLRSTSRSPTRCSTSPRTGAGALDHCANPRWADATARATSSGPERGQQPMTSSRSAGLRFSTYAPVAGATHWPPTQSLKLSALRRQRGVAAPSRRHGGERRLFGGRLPAAQRRVRVGELLEQTVYLGHLFVPIPLLVAWRHYASRASL